MKKQALTELLYDLLAEPEEKQVTPPRPGVWGIIAASGLTGVAAGLLLAVGLSAIGIGPGRDGRGGKGGIGSGPQEAVSAELWPGHDRGGDGVTWTDRRDVQRLLLLTSARPARGWAARVSGPEGARAVTPDKGSRVPAARPLLVPVGPPGREVDAEWFVALFVPEGDSPANAEEELERAVNRLRPLLKSEEPALLRATTPQLIGQLEKGLTDAVATPDSGVKVVIAHWKVRD